MKKMVLILVWMAAGMASAAQVFYENFQATSGNENGAVWHSSDASAVWSSGYTASEAPLTSSGDLSYSGLVDSAGGGKINIYNPTDTDRGYTFASGQYAVTDGSAYYSFLLNVTDFSGIKTNWDKSNWFMAIDAAPYNVVGLRSDGAGGGYLMLARGEADMINGPTDADCSSEVALSANTTYLVVVCISDVLTDSSAFNLWVNPASLGGTAPAPNGAGRCRTYAGGSDVLYFGNDENVAGGSVLTGVNIDELRVGTTYADVTPEDQTPRSTFFFIK